tara:strand:- start:34 stop:648 length:615 start_codon:yes stop_codon:yes gene_type:complete
MLKHFIITLILSCLVSFKSYALDKILLYGDSLMSGYKLDRKNSLNNILEQKLLLLGYNYKIINASIPGETSFGGLNRLEWTLAEKNITHIVLCLGANDMLRGIKPNETYKNLENIIKIINDKNIKVILAGMVAPSSYGKKYKDSFDHIYPDLAKKFKILFIPFLLKDVALIPELNLSDGIHPNKKGVEIISNTIFKKLITALKN